VTLLAHYRSSVTLAADCASDDSKGQAATVTDDDAPSLENSSLVDEASKVATVDSKPTSPSHVPSDVRICTSVAHTRSRRAVP
jgi:hypothetical protein